MTLPFTFTSLKTPALMGIVNVTPDSFSDGGRFFDPRAAADHALKLAAEGASIVDLGAEATSFFRAGVTPVPAEEQLRRLLPVLELLRGMSGDIVISVDTRSAEVARAVLGAGATIINDISAGTHDPEMLGAVAEAGAGIVLMHMSPGFPATPEADDPNIVESVRQYLEARVHEAIDADITPQQIAVDPGVGFGKTMADNWRLTMRAGELRQLAGVELPVVLGVSRKRFLETPAPADVRLPLSWEKGVAAAQAGLEQPRDAATALLTGLTARVVGIHRVHNVALSKRVLTPR